MADHYFSADPESSAKTQSIDFNVRGRHYTLLASTGVFSAGRLDPGTAVLLKKSDLPGPEIAGPLLDLGCGYGPIAVVLADHAPNAEVWAVDVNSRARELAERNTNGRKVKVSAPHLVPAEIEFEQIWSNPPIRIGKQELHELLLLWLPRLKADGVAWLVVAKHLGSDSLQKWLIEQGWPTEKHASGSGYRVLKVSRGQAS
ncbi:class I SAM-dependent methyltransferase [Catelliglobosispora koreensis]|uniref:class I SAM-dependent methyltransferase n=1 Tax=Catelliglobosispora koreensis TaxID=129052 RepID=UPI00037BF930|nr:methyltransferase [Catelliglobosispora koreensis]